MAFWQCRRSCTTDSEDHPGAFLKQLYFSSLDHAFFTQFGLYPPPLQAGGSAEVNVGSGDSSLVIWDDDSDDQSVNLPTPSNERSLSLALLDPTEEREGETLPQEILAAEEMARESKQSGPFHVAVALMKGFFGGSVVLWPHIMEQAGVFTYIVVSFLVWLSTTTGMLLLLDCLSEQEVHSGTYGRVGRLAFGEIGKKIVNLAIGCTQLLFSVGYCVFIAEATNSALRYHIGGAETSPVIPWSLLFGFQLFLLVPLVLIRRIRYFAPFVLVANILVVLLVLSILASSINVAQHGERTRIPVAWTLNSQWTVALGQVVYMWEGVGVILPVRASMKRQDVHKLPMLLTGVLFALWILCTLYPLTTYVALGGGINPMVILMLPQGQTMQAVNFVFIIIGVLTFPLIMFPAVRLTENKLFRSLTPGKKRKWLKNMTRTAMVGATIVTGMFIRQNLNAYFSVVGAAFCTPLLIVFPAIFHMKLRGNWGMLREVKPIAAVLPHTIASRIPVQAVHIWLLAFGVILFVLTGIQMMSTLVQSA